MGQTGSSIECENNDFESLTLFRDRLLELEVKNIKPIEPINEETANTPICERPATPKEPPPPKERTNPSADIADAEEAPRRNADDAEGTVPDAPRDEFGSDYLDYVVSSSIANVGHVAAMKILQEFENYLDCDDEANRMDDLFVTKTYMESSISELDDNSITYEEVPRLPIEEIEETSKHDIEVVKNDSESTFVLKDIEMVKNESESTFVLKDIEICKEDSETDSWRSPSCESPPSDATKQAGDGSAPSAFSDESPTPRDDEDEDLRALLERLKFERDEAQIRLRAAEERCQAYEKESRCLEATLGCMEEKLRSIVSELSGELKKSKDLEQQLSEGFRKESGDSPSSSSNL